MDPQILPLNTSNGKQKDSQLPDNNNKTILLSTTTNKNQLVFLKPNNVNNKMYCVLRPEDLHLKLPSPIKVAKPGRPKRVHNEEESIDLADQSQLENNIEEIPARKVFRTRSGRVTKPPRYINQESSNKTDSPINLITQQIQPPPETIIMDNKLSNTKKPESISNVIEQKRNISSQYRCETCKKAYLGRAKMLKHLQLNSDHVAAPKFFKNDKNRQDLWTNLINRTKSVPQDERVRFIYDEFVTFIQKAREIFPKLLKTGTDIEKNPIKVDQIFSNVLGVTEGSYSFVKQNVADILNVGLKENRNKTTNEIVTVNSESVQQNVTNNTNGFDTQTNEKEFVQEITNSESAQIQNTDQNSLLNLLDTGQVTFDNSNSEEVMNVDQLIHERLKSLTGGEIETNSASQNLHLDLSLDMFPYHTNNI